jgi:hypothetical protein
MASANPTNEEHDNTGAEETFLDPNEAVEEYAEDHESGDHPMSSDDEDGEDMLDEEVIVDDSIQGFFLHTSPVYSVALHENWLSRAAETIWDTCGMLPTEK